MGRNEKRPTAHEWIPQLESLSRNLKRCPVNQAHFHMVGLASCPWCTVEAAKGIPMFGFKVAVLRGQEFDLVAIWRQIESVRPDESATPRSTNAYTDQCKPDPRIEEIRQNRRNKRSLSIGSILLAVFVVATGVHVFPEVVSIGILTASIAGMIMFWREGGKGTAEFERAHKDALRHFLIASSRWNNVQKAPETFVKAKKLLEAQKQALERLLALRNTKMAQLHTDVHRKQLHRWLEKHKIEDAAIPNIGRGRKNTLRAYGIEDASDIHLSMQIKGFGPSLTAALWNWRTSVEHLFVSNPKEGIDPADIRALDVEIAQKRASLVQALSSGPLTLRNILLPRKVERDTVLGSLIQCTKAVAQADVNMRQLARW